MIWSTLSAVCESTQHDHPPHDVSTLRAPGGRLTWVEHRNWSDYCTLIIMKHAPLQAEWKWYVIFSSCWSRDTPEYMFQHVRAQTTTWEHNIATAQRVRFAHETSDRALSDAHRDRLLQSINLGFNACFPTVPCEFNNLRQWQHLKDEIRM